MFIISCFSKGQLGLAGSTSHFLLLSYRPCKWGWWLAGLYWVARDCCGVGDEFVIGSGVSRGLGWVLVRCGDFQVMGNDCGHVCWGAELFIHCPPIWGMVFHVPLFWDQIDVCRRNCTAPMSVPFIDGFSFCFFFHAFPGGSLVKLLGDGGMDFGGWVLASR